jgi:hypothetical protein
MKLSEKVSLTIALSAVPAQSTGFSIPGLIVDAAEVPVYQRVQQVTRSDYATILATTASARAWAAKLWYTGNVAAAYIIRWASTAQPSRFVMEDYNPVLTLWKAATTSLDFAITDGSTTEQFTAALVPDATTINDVCASLQTAIRASVSFGSGAEPDGDLTTATVAIDALGNMVLSSSETGADATTYSIIAPTTPAGTDITGANFLNIASGAYEVAGMAAEDPDDALTAAMALGSYDSTIRIIHEIGASISQQFALDTACNALGKILLLNVRDPNAVDSTDNTNIAYLLSAASARSWGAYTENVGDYPSATLNGQILTRPEGSASAANNPLTGIYESGLYANGSPGRPLTPTERAALDLFNCDYVVRPISNNLFNCGLTFAGVELKHIVGYKWAELRSAEEIEAYLEANEVTFSDADIQAICAIIFKYLDILVDRKCSTSYTINVPSAADISLIEQATHKLTLSEVAAVISAYAVNQVVATATATA